MHGINLATTASSYSLPQQYRPQSKPQHSNDPGQRYSVCHPFMMWSYKHSILELHTTNSIFRGPVLVVQAYVCMHTCDHVQIHIYTPVHEWMSCLVDVMQSDERRPSNSAQWNEQQQRERLMRCAACAIWIRQFYMLIHLMEHGLQGGPW